MSYLESSYSDPRYDGLTVFFETPRFVLLNEEFKRIMNVQFEYSIKRNKECENSCGYRNQNLSTDERRCGDIVDATRWQMEADKGNPPIG